MHERLGDTEIVAELTDMQRMIPALAEAEILIGHIWRQGFPEAPRLRLFQAATAGIDMIDVPSLPNGITVCNVYGHEPAIAEYVIDRAGPDPSADRYRDAFRAGSGRRISRPAVRRTAKSSARRRHRRLGRIGREVAQRAVPFGSKVIAANRSPVADKGDASEIYPLAELDHMLRNATCC